jgi:SpoVK/Ycf46/Vps4 family AAA+-type ATPase
MKTELLIQMDGLASHSHTNNNSNNSNNSNNNQHHSQVFVLAASNVPWDLDSALLRRLEKRVLVSLPTPAARCQMLRQYLGGRVVPEIDFLSIAEQLEGYSGADIEILSREAAMRPLRRLLTALDRMEPPPTNNNHNNHTHTTVHQSMSTNHSNNSNFSKRLQLPKSIDVEGLLHQDPITLEDLEAAIRSTRPSAGNGTGLQNKLKRYEQWQEAHGAV